MIRRTDRGVLSRTAFFAAALGGVLVHPGIAIRSAHAGGPYDLTTTCAGDPTVNGAALRAALRAAGDDPKPVVITLASKCTYAFADADPGDASHVPGNWYGPTALPAITNDITIVGAGSTITRTGTKPFRLFTVVGPTAVASNVQAGLRAGALTLRDLQISNGLARGGDGGAGIMGGGGGGGFGGAIFAEGDLTLVSVTLSGNAARGGDGGKATAFTGGSYFPGGGGGGMGGKGGDVGGFGGGGGGGMGGNGGVGALGGGGGFHGNGGGGSTGASSATGGGGGGVYTDASGGAPGDGGGTPGAGSSSTAWAGTKGFPGGGGGSSSLAKGTDAAANGGGGGFGGGGGGGSVGGDGGFGGGGAGGGGSNVSSGGKGGFGGGAGAGSSGGTAGGFGGGSGAHGTATPAATAPYGGGGAKFSGGTPAVGGGGAGLGGAIFVMAGNARITNTTLSGNLANGGTSGAGGEAGAGAGAAVFVYGGTATVDSTTVVGNASTTGGALEVYTGGTLRVSNSLVVATSGSPCQRIGGGAFASLAGNVVQGTGSCAFGVGDKVNPTPAPAPAALADNGGPTPTHAINKVDPAYGAAKCVVTTDQRGVRRPQPTTCDAGAYELATSVTVTVTGSGSVSGAPGVLACGAVCSDAFKPGTPVVLTATPVAPATFLGWSGDFGAGSATASTASVTVELKPLAIAAKFEALDAGADASSEGGATDAGGTPPDAAGKPVVGAGVTSCTTDAECGGKRCVEGVCCDRACDGVCESCRVPTAPGVCTTIPFGTDPKGACTSGTICLKTCDGAGRCVDAQTGTQCAPSVCLDGSKVRGIGVCSAKGGACSAPTATFDCAPYTCDTVLGGCKNGCATSNDCASGYVCDLASRLCTTAPPSSDDGGCAFGRSGGSRTFLA
ncbi:MAG: hypothetical protein JNL79_25365, partial [Myxococcales bacterium]|nr:hypothetical protein [Myxococcales bacterium]